MIICPECKSHEVMIGEPSENFDGETTITCVCLDCGYAWETEDLEQ
jgi:DNA-directed RNA polymerase subunit M/transcription elongation factor TFIIS